MLRRISLLPCIALYLENAFVCVLSWYFSFFPCIFSLYEEGV